MSYATPVGRRRKSQLGPHVPSHRLVYKSISGAKEGKDRNPSDPGMRSDAVDVSVLPDSTLQMVPQR
ncbi:hypothetical protein HS088_TW01G00718 [Tripterygium wilfordii]|uniref:Uncharacterized protein n=1 Tax=Tripterygium wilfordii TaxID=458696 RepID=A0A7J7E2D1_TRIWF|nr:hypothetical protein HS088_TW01G00718 [Tripterygium wilfordii]